ncbi:MAG TPA: hypothetical protein VGF67_30110 [Ktedonobacteraceae bacterium]|jgi:hypothetical protein
MQTHLPVGTGRAALPGRTCPPATTGPAASSLSNVEHDHAPESPQGCTRAAVTFERAGSLP